MYRYILPRWLLPANRNWWSHASPEPLRLAPEGAPPAGSDAGYTITGLDVSPRQRHATAAAYRSWDIKDGSRPPRGSRRGPRYLLPLKKNPTGFIFSLRDRRPSLAREAHDTPLPQTRSHNPAWASTDAARREAAEEDADPPHSPSPGRRGRWGPRRRSPGEARSPQGRAGNGGGGKPARRQGVCVGGWSVPEAAAAAGAPPGSAARCCCGRVAAAAASTGGGRPISSSSSSSSIAAASPRSREERRPQVPGMASSLRAAEAYCGRGRGREAGTSGSGGGCGVWGGGGKHCGGERPPPRAAAAGRSALRPPRPPHVTGRGRGGATAWPRRGPGRGRWWRVWGGFFTRSGEWAPRPGVSAASPPAAVRPRGPVEGGEVRANGFLEERRR